MKKWLCCLPCAVVWIGFGAALAARWWLWFDWANVVVLMLFVVFAAVMFAIDEPEDANWLADSAIAEVWWFFNKPRTPPRWATWFRQLFCFHGPYRTTDIGYGFDHYCRRCGKLCIRERAA